MKSAGDIDLVSKRQDLKHGTNHKLGYRYWPSAFQFGRLGLVIISSTSISSITAWTVISLQPRLEPALLKICKVLLILVRKVF